MLRKGSVWLLCAIMMLSLTMPFVVLAEGELEVYNVSVDTGSTTWVVTWESSDEGSRLLSVQLSGASGGSATLPVISNSVGYAEVDASGAPYGTSTVDLAFGTSSGVETVYASGGTYVNSAQIPLAISLDFSGELVTVQVTDSSGNGVANVPISVNIGDSIGALSNQTDDYGYASFSVDGIAGGQTWEIIAEGFDSGDGVEYSSAYITAVVGQAETTVGTTSTIHRVVETTQKPVATEPPQDEYSEPEPSEVSEEESEPEMSEEEVSKERETSPQLPTLPEEETGGVSEIPVYDAVRGATTTHAGETEIACNLSVDKSLLSLLKLKIGAFNKSGRLVVTKEDYAELVELYGGTMTGSLLASPYEAVTTEQISKSMQSESAFSESSPEKALRVTFGLALDFIQEGSDEPLHVTDLSEAGGDWMFDVQIPVPGNMKKCKSFGVAMTGDNTLTPLTQVKAEDGVISFRTPVLGYYTLVGFTDGKAASSGMSPLKTLFIVLIVVGVLMLGGCGFLTYWFFFRKKGLNDDDDDYSDPDDNAYYEEAMPDDEQERADADAFMHDIMGGEENVDIYSSAEREAEAMDPILSARQEVDRGGDDIFGLYSHRIDE